ncbi:MAG: NUDIX hydrolase [Gammaproteobacteria bacterium]|nr:NUDIX hydrolase [Gammaproteobacteria bacterium]
MRAGKILCLIDAYRERYPEETDAARLHRFIETQPRCFERDCFDDGHVTGSAWVVDSDGSRVLLTHHRKLGKWLQLGGHSDGEPDTLAVALREAREESGLVVRPISEAVLDVDIHTIPASKGEPAHLHYDVRFAFRAASSGPLRVSPESIDLAWVEIGDLARLTGEESMLRMARKFLASHKIGAGE